MIAGRCSAALILVALALLGPASVVAQEELPPDAPATAVRVRLGRLLAEHAFLTLEAVRSGLAMAPELTAAAGALDANTEEIVDAIGSVYGPEVGDAFGQQWRNHIGYLVDYTRAVAADDAEAAELSAVQLDQYVSDFSALIAEAMPSLPADAVNGLIGEHVQQLEHIAALDESDFGHAYPALRETYRHMFQIGDSMAVGIVGRFPDRFGGRAEAFGPATDLRLSLDRLLGEHTHLAALAMRARLRGAPDTAGASEALDANSSELQGVIGQIYGDQAAAAFGDLWSAHVASYFAYVEGLANGSEAQSADALAALDAYHREFTAFVVAANPFVSAPTLESLIVDHVSALVSQADAYARSEFEDAYRIDREAYAHTAELSARLAAGIAQQFPDRFPDVATVLPRQPSLMLGAGLVALAAATLAAAVLRRRPGA